MEYNFFYLHVFLVPFSITSINNPFQEETNKLRSQNLKNSVNSLNFNFSFYEGFELLISTFLNLISFFDVLLLQISQNVSIFSSLKRSKLSTLKNSILLNGEWRMENSSFSWNYLCLAILQKFQIRLWLLKPENPNRTNRKPLKHLKRACPKSLPFSLCPNFPREF